jgi:DNA repair exonuclease SbcCD nuclease subunit
MDLIRVLFVSDTHLGFDLPRRPRVERRRRGPDFFENFERALEPARRGEIDLVIHGGDILFRSRVPAELVAKAFEPLKKIAESGVSVYVVPGNHERSRIPYALLAQHENLFLFDRPKTYMWRHQGFTLALAGFPYERRVRARFTEVVEDTGWRHVDADAKLLMMHHAVEGARVGRFGMGDYTFTSAADVVRTADIPKGFTAILSGHIHRAQVLTRDLGGRPLPAPVLYPGSVERTSFAEKDERKGYLTFALERSGALRGWRFHELPARPMVTIELGPRELARDNLAVRLRRRLEMLPVDAVVQLKIDGAVPKVLGAASLRALAPSSMNVTISVTPGDRWRRPSSRTERF